MFAFNSHLYTSGKIAQMRHSWIICSPLILALLEPAYRIDAQTNAVPTQPAATYNLNVPVDEVVLTFHAADSHDLPVNDLKLDELNILDNGKPPRKVLAFQLLQDFPIRAGILIDTSQSMEEHLSGARAISIKYAQSLLRQQTDQAFVMDFGHSSTIIQSWTSNTIALTEGIHKGTAGGKGTAIFDAIYSACRYEFGKIDHATSGNFILLFSDGEDNTSHLPLKEAVDMCQRTNTVIYAFRAAPEFGSLSGGLKTLLELTSQTGGRLFHDDDTESEIYTDLHIIEADLRNQYRLVYKPPTLKHDGSFHPIELKAPKRVDNIRVRSGYYSPAH